MNQFIRSFLTSEQVKAIIERGATVFATWLATWLVQKGYLGASDAAQFIAAIVGLGAMGWGAWVNRDKALVQAAATVPNTTVVTEHAVAVATPEPNIVSAAVKEVVSKAM